MAQYREDLRQFSVSCTDTSYIHIQGDGTLPLDAAVVAAAVQSLNMERSFLPLHWVVEMCCWALLASFPILPARGT